jgi:hypothetical protein
MSRRQFVFLLTALHSHEFPNSKVGGDAAQAKRVANVEKGFVSADNQIRSREIMTQLPSLCVLYQSRGLCIYGN